MIKDNFLPTTETLSDTYSLTDTISNLKLETIPDAYYIGWLRYENAPNHFNISKVDVLIDNGEYIYNFTPIRIPNNYNVLYLGNKASTYVDSAVNVSILKGESGYLENNKMRFINKLDVMKEAATPTFTISIEYYKIVNKKFAERGKGSIDLTFDTIIDLYNFLYNDYGKEINLQGNIFNVKVSDFNNYLCIKRIDDNNWYEMFAITVSVTYKRSYEDLGSGFPTCSPALFMKFQIDDENREVLFGGNIIGMSEKLFMKISDKNPSYNLINNYFYGVVKLSQLNNIINPYDAAIDEDSRPYFFDANGLYLKKRDRNSVIWTATIFNTEDLIRTLSLLAVRYSDKQKDSGMPYKGYIENEVFAPLVTENNEFTTQLITGHLEDTIENFDKDFKDKLRPWQYNVDEWANEYTPDDLPDYVPGGDTPVTPDDDGDISIGSVPVGITNAFTNCYIMNTGAVDYAGKILWTGLGSQQAESGLTFGGMVKNFFGLFTDVKSETTDSTYRELALNTILDYFVSLRYYPIQNLFSYTQATVTDHLSVGTGQEPIVMAATGGFGVPQRRIVQMSGGQLTRAELNASGKVYNSFLDYQPNTTATLYIPYCGTVELTPSQLLDCDTIDIVYALDIMTGALSAIAMKNGTASYPLAMLQGTCGFETLVSGSNKGIVELATSISNLRFGANTSNQIVQGLTNSAVGSASQNAENAEVNTQAMLIRGIASAYNAGTSMYNYLVGLPTMTGVSPISAGSMSSLASTIMPQTAYIQLTKHSADIPTNFENTYGRTTNVYGSIGSYQGYLICGNPRLEGIPCTEHERDEIFSLLTTGVYVE